MCFDRRGVGLIKLDGGICKSFIRIAALTLQAFLRTERSVEYVRIIVGLQIRRYICGLAGVSDAHQIRSCLGGLEGISHGERNVLAIVTNDIVGEWRPPLITNA